MDVGALLLQVKNGQMAIEEAERLLKDLPYEELGYAKLDHHRKLRSGFGETVFCQGKPDAYLAEIFRKLWERDGEVLGTRATPEQYELVRSIVPEVVYDPISRILKADKPEKQKEPQGLIAVCTGGTADIPVAEEAAQTAEYFGCRVDRGGDSPAAGTAPQTGKCQLHYCSGRNGGGFGNSDCRTGRLSCYSGSHIRRLRGKLSWSVSPSDHD